MRERKTTSFCYAYKESSLMIIFLKNGASIAVNDKNIVTYVLPLHWSGVSVAVGTMQSWYRNSSQPPATNNTTVSTENIDNFYLKKKSTII